MSAKPTAPNDIRRLLDDGYEAEVKNGYLLVRTPYVNAQCQVRWGAVITDISENAGELLPPKDHQVWFVGDYPCHANGRPIAALTNTSGTTVLWEGFAAQHRFSNKPFGVNNYPSLYEKMLAYVTIISGEARAIASSADPRTFRVVSVQPETSVFRYRDSASTRADILAVSQRLAVDRIAIVGLGGTGSYVLDLVAKTHVREIHLFDGDEFLQHNAFRAPGAASVDDLIRRLPKVTYYQQIYDAMRQGVVPHAEYVTEENTSKLNGFSFVFLCVDSGPVRKLISAYLQAQGIAFVDVGMELSLVPEEGNLIGTCRVTMSTPAQWTHFTQHAPMMADDEDDLYRKSIQVADMNMLNAALAVLQWKRYLGFYQDNFQPHHSTFSINSQSLTRDVMKGAPLA